MKAMSKAMVINLCSNETPREFADCYTGVPNKPVRTFVRDTIIEPHTIYDLKHKTTEQITDILLEVERQFLVIHPDYVYDNYRYEDGKYGERTVFLIFKLKPCSP